MGSQSALVNLDQWPVLSSKDEVSLAQTIEAGSEAEARLRDQCSEDTKLDVELITKAREARDYFICSNLRLVVKCALKFRDTLGIELDDHIHHGVEGLIRAVDRWDWRKGHKFSTYALWWIRVYITRSYAESSKIIRTPLAAHVNIEKARSAYERLLAAGVAKPTHEQISEESGLTDKQISKALSIPSTKSDNEKTVDGYSAFSHFDIIASNSPEADPEYLVIKEEISAQIAKVLTSLTTVEARIIALRYGFMDGRVWNLTAIGKEVGLPRLEIHKRLTSAEQKLRADTSLRILAQS